MASDDEVNAAFVAVQPDLHNLVIQFVPYFMQGQALQTLASHEGRADVVKIIEDALEAAEAVRVRKSRK